MRCTQCGLPLSPTRNSCPRCGTPINTSNPAWAESSPHPASASAPQMPFPAPQQPQLSFEDRPLAESMQQANMPASYPVNNQPNRSGPSLTHKPASSTRSRSKTTTIGLTSAGLCIVAGSLLLVFVYLVGQGILPVGTTSASDTQLSNTVKANQTATAIHLSTPTTPPITPTPTLPAQGLLDTSVLSNNFDQQTGQILQQSTSFQVNQIIYLVFTMHPGGSSHTACVNWYLNDQLMNTSSQAVGPASNIKYFFYTIMHAPGNGRVDILLSNTTVCSDAILAKRLPFTVSA